MIEKEIKIVCNFDAQTSHKYGKLEEKTTTWKWYRLFYEFLSIIV